MTIRIEANISENVGKAKNGICGNIHRPIDYPINHHPSRLGCKECSGCDKRQRADMQGKRQNELRQRYA